MDKKFWGLISFAILIEGIITYINQFFVNGSFCWEMLFSISLGIIVALAYNLDLPEYFNIKARVPYIGCVLTGILISRGSNYIFDLLSEFTQI